jgi:hypothetical protein
MPEAAQDRSTVAEGLVVATGGAVVLCVVMLPLITSTSGAGIALPIVLAIGVTQLIYVIPVALVYRKRGRIRALKGLLSGAAVVFLLNATCWGVGFAIT